jgi:hypothetical protein
MVVYGGVQVGLIIFLGYDKLYFLLTTPLYLVLFLLVGCAAVSYFQQVPAAALVADCLLVDCSSSRQSRLIDSSSSRLIGSSSSRLIGSSSSTLIDSSSSRLSTTSNR